MVVRTYTLSEQIVLLIPLTLVNCVQVVSYLDVVPASDVQIRAVPRRPAGLGVLLHIEPPDERHHDVLSRATDDDLKSKYFL